MNTTVKDWYIVSVFDDEELIGKILWGTWMSTTGEN